MAQLRNPMDPFGYGAEQMGVDAGEGDPNAGAPPPVQAQPEAPPAAPPPQAPPQANPYDYEGFRTGWLTAGFGKQTSPQELAQHAAKWGVTIRNGDKAYDPQGNFIADLVGDVGGRNTLQFLRGTGGTGKVPKGGISPRGGGNLPKIGGGGYDKLIDYGGGISSAQGAPGAKGKGTPKVVMDPKTGKPKVSKPKKGKDPVPKGGISLGGPGNLPPGGPAPGGPAGPSAGPPAGPPTGPTDGGGEVMPPTTEKAPPDMNAILSQLQGLFKGGGFNQGLVDNRVSSANDALNRSRKSRLATNRAALAERGMLNSQDSSTMNRMDEDLFETQAGAVRDIYGDEAQRADSRMAQALQTAAGLSGEQARQVIDKYRADNEKAFNEGNLALGGRRLSLDDKLGTGRLRLDTELGRGNLALGRGNLALGNRQAQNQYNLGTAGLGLDRDRLGWDMTRGSNDQMIELLRSYLSGAQSTR